MSLCRTGLCARCCLKDDLGDLLRDEHGGIAAHMHPLYQALTTQANARSARVWIITNKPAKELLRALATGTVSLTHGTESSTRHREKFKHLRKLMMSLGMIEETVWAHRTVRDLARPETSEGPLPKHKQLITQFARFVHLNRMRHLARQDALKEGTLLSARQSTSTAIEFLGFWTGAERTLVNAPRRTSTIGWQAAQQPEASPARSPDGPWTPGTSLNFTSRTA